MTSEEEFNLMTNVSNHFQTNKILNTLLFTMTILLAVITIGFIIYGIVCVYSLDPMFGPSNLMKPKGNTFKPFSTVKLTPEQQENKLSVLCPKLKNLENYPKECVKFDSKQNT